MGKRNLQDFLQKIVQENKIVLPFSGKIVRRSACILQDSSNLTLHLQRISKKLQKWENTFHDLFSISKN